MKSKEYNELTKEDKLKVKFKDLPTINKFGCLSMITFAIIIVIIILFAIFSDKSINKDHVKSVAYQISKQYVKENLKAPSTADFPFDDYKSWIFDDSTVVIKGYVDAQNTFGAQVRQNYRIKLKWKDDYDVYTNWQLIEFNFEE